MRGKILRLIGAVIAVASLGLVGFWAWDAPMGSGAAPSQETSFDVVVDPKGLTLACPPGIVDPNEEKEITGATAFFGDEGEPIEGGGQTVEAKGDGTLQAAGVKSGDFASFLLEGCALPSRHLTLLPGSTVVQERSIIILANPSTKPVEAEVTLYGPLGPAGEGTFQEVVAAGSTKIVQPAALAPDAKVVAAEVVSDGGGLAAWIQTSGLDGEVPLGVGRTAGGTPTTTQVLAGLVNNFADNLFIFNPEATAVEANVFVLTDTGKEPLAGAGEVTIPGQSVATVSLAGLDETVHGLVVQAGSPVFAVASMESAGAKHEEVSSSHYFSRAYLPSGLLVTEVLVPASKDVAAAAKEAGGKVESASVVFANPRSAGVTVTYGKNSFDVPAGGTLEVEAVKGDEPVAVESSQPIAVTYVARVSQAQGAVIVPTPLGGQGSTTQNRLVELFPSQ